MDPLSALAIAGAVMQVISFSHEMIDLYSKIKSDGSPDASLAEKSAQLSSTAKILSDKLGTKWPKPLTKDQKTLQQIAEKCLDCGKNLTDELNKIEWKPSQNGSKPRVQRGTISQMWMTWRRKPKIEKLEKDLKDVEQTMQTTILTSSWISIEAMSAVQEHGFKNLDSQTQKVISKNAEGNRQLSDLIMDQAASIKKVVIVQSSMTRAQLSDQEHARQLAELDKATRTQLLGSLEHALMRERKSRVHETYKKTFEWVFDEQISHEWDSFSAWLKSSERVYWISGKPGSGKSTLMNFIVENSMTFDALKEWDPSAAIISFFFWSSGSKMQNSLQGLLCTLLYQALDMNQDLIRPLTTEDSTLLKKKTFNDWSDRGLEKLLVKVISKSKQRLCLFLDGLDEIDRKEGCFNLVQLIGRLEAQTTVKLCVSSRPEGEFRNAFGKRRTLRLEDLTRMDISDYVAGFFQENLQFWEDSDSQTEASRQTILDEVLTRAAGVFLWVELVLQSLRSGVIGIDSYDQLYQRINQTPSELEDLYKAAWKRHGKNEAIYRDEAALYFKLVLESRRLRDTLEEDTDFTGIPLSLLEFFIASNDQIRDHFLKDGNIPPLKTLIARSRDFRARVESRSGGLLEVFNSDSNPNPKSQAIFLEKTTHNFLPQFLAPLSLHIDPTPGTSGITPSGQDLAELWNISHNLTVGFIHRTAAEFVFESDWGKELLESIHKSDIDIQISLYQSRMAHALLFWFPNHQHGGFSYRANAESFIGIFEKLRPRISHEQYQSLLEALENVCDRIVDQSLSIDRLISGLCDQIQKGHSDAQYYKTMFEFVNSCTLQHFEQFWTTNAAKAPGSFSNTNSITIEKLSSLMTQCQQIIDNSLSSCAILLEDADWQTNITGYPLPSQLSDSNITFAQLISHVFFMTWVLVDARKYLRQGTICMLADLGVAAAKNNLLGCLQRCFARRPDVYNNLEIFKKMLMLAALQFGRDKNGTAAISVSLKADETIRWLLSTGVDPSWTIVPGGFDCPRLTLFEWFLLSVPTMCQSSTEEDLESRIFLTTRAFIQAGADLRRLACLRFCSPSSIPLREVQSEVPESIDITGHELELIVEVNGFQLLDRARAAIRCYVQNKGTELIHDWEDLGIDGYSSFRPRVLAIREVLNGTDNSPFARFFPIDSNNSEAIVERFIFENSRSPKEWADSGSIFEVETIRVVDKIRSQGGPVVDLESWLKLQGYPIAYGWQDSWNYELRRMGTDSMDMGSRLYAQAFS